MGAKGYSLLELLVVLAIMGLVLALAAPAAIDAGGSMALKADARALASRLRELRADALDRQRDIVIEARGGRLRVSGDSSSAALLPEGTAAVVEDARPQAGARRFVLRHDGSASGAIRLRRSGREVRIAADAATGRIRVEAGGP